MALFSDKCVSICLSVHLSMCLPACPSGAVVLYIWYHNCVYTFVNARACMCPCRHQNVRANYITEFWKVVDWTVVSKNFAAAQAGNVQSMVE